MQKYHRIGLDIGGTKCAVSLGEIEDGTIRILDRKEYPTVGSPHEVLDLFLPHVEAYKKAYPVDGVGISCGGPLDGEKGIILTPPNLPNWHYFDVVSYVEERFGLPAKLENDANACALAEWLFGAGRGATNMIFMTFGTGLGAGLILNGKLYVGANGNAGEAGHIRLAEKGPTGYGKSGSFEGFCSGAGIVKLARELAKKEKNFPTLLREIGEENLTTKSLAEAAKRGDEFAQKEFWQSGKRLGRGLSTLIDLFNPEKIVLGGVFMRAEELLRPAMERELKRETLSVALEVCEIVAAGLKENIGDYAAIAVTMR